MTGLMVAFCLFDPRHAAYVSRMTYVLHYAPDNASLIVRLALEHFGLPYQTQLVDRRVQAHRSKAYRALNPAGKIPVLVTPEGPVFETAAILLWLGDRHTGLAPVTDAPDRGAFLSWLFFLSNTLHAQMRLLFYPDQIVTQAHLAALEEGAKASIRQSLQVLETSASSAFAQAAPTLLDFYIGPLLRWCAIYGPEDRSWFSLQDYPRLASLTRRLETLPSTQAAQTAEGLGPTPFSAPVRPTPPEGSAL